MKKKQCFLFILICLLFNQILSFSNDKSIENQAKNIANIISLEIKREEFHKIKQFEIQWAAHMKTKFGVTLIMNATLKMKNENNGYSSTFKIEKPKGKNVWSWFMLNMFGKRTVAYKSLVNSIEIIVLEYFQIGKRCLVTDSIEEFLPGKKQYKNQTSIKIDFDKEKKTVSFFKDKTKNETPEVIPYSGQAGPFTAFFNYMFFYPYETDIEIINALKQIPDPTTLDIKLKRRRVNYLFNSEVLHLVKNNTGLKTKYVMALSMDKGNLFDTIYGENIFYQLQTNKQASVNIPYVINIEGLIDKAKKQEKLKKLNNKFPNKIITEKDVFKKVDDILVVKDVRLYLTDYKIVKS